MLPLFSDISSQCQKTLFDVYVVFAGDFKEGHVEVVGNLGRQLKTVTNEKVKSLED